ncbi:MAG: three-Cys-motif partner protein TcmP [Syntrophobacter sp.]
MLKYDAWEDEKLPVIEVHSQKKHEVIREYLKDYIRIVGTRSHHRNSLNLTLIDGFAGGGLYTKDDGSIHLGSPLLLIKTIEEMQFEINQERLFNLNANFIFIEKNKKILEFLRKNIINQGYKNKIDNQIYLLDGEFETHNHDVIDFILKRPDRAHRCIFLLDQYGYKEVRIKQLRKIFASLPKAEVILTFAVDWMLDNLSDSNISDSILKGFDLDLNASDLIRTKKMHKSWRMHLQSDVYKRIASDSGASYWTNFFIKSPKDNKSYWLLHLSMHPEARNAMLELHWKLRNHFHHEGSAGFFMLGYDPKKVSDPGQSFIFSPRDRDLTHNALLKQIPTIIPIDGISLKNLYINYCNESTATYDIFKGSIQELHKFKEIEVFTPSSRKKRGNTISDDDSICRMHQLIIDYRNPKK